MFACCTLNHSRPLRSNTGVCGSRAAASGIGYSVTLPVRGSSLPTSAPLLPVYQMLPAVSSVKPCGPDCGVFNGNSFIAPVFGSSRPSTFAHCPVHQSEPSDAASGSCGREPSVGTIHSRMEIVTGPGTTTGSPPGLRGKCSARYVSTVSFIGAGRAIMPSVNWSQSGRLFPREFVMFVSG